ncbi:MAG: sigma 54-interacting transcriptional regulator [Clostridiales Family XIII bacterium]|nr:sigma 54-interacting transcriptional regulator [Clostridiales Family XIII bacterium]
MKKIFEQMGVVAITDSEGKYLYVNPLWERDTGLAKADVLGRYCNDVVEDSKAMVAIKAKKTVVAEFGISLVKKKHVPGIISYMPIFDRDNVVGCFISAAFPNIVQANKFADRVKKFMKLDDTSQNLAKYNTADIIGESPEIIRLKEQILLAAASDAKVLIEGETGTGKELVAHAIHRNSQRCRFPLIRVNCSAIPEHLIESEFFGYEGGSFTGAVAMGREGKFESADKGSLFLDEINCLPITMQPKLLRVLQEEEIDRIGSNGSIPVDVRVIAASGKSIKKMCNEGTFRNDLYYRLNIIHITIPPLRKRKEDIPLLINSMINRWNGRGNRLISGVTAEAMDFLMSQDWPGNVRELQNSFERAATISHSEMLESASFEQEAMEFGGDMMPVGGSGGQSGDISLRKRKNSMEKEVIESVLRQHGGNKSKAAEALNISRTMLYKKIKKYSI